jgi:two-component system cell cycle response regulator
VHRLHHGWPRCDGNPVDGVSVIRWTPSQAIRRDKPFGARGDGQDARSCPRAKEAQSTVSQQATTAAHVEELLRYDARAALQRARELLSAAGTDSDNIAYQRLLLIKGAAQARIGETEDGARVMREVTAWAAEHGEDDLLARSHRRISALFRRIGDPALMLEHAVTAVDLLDDDTPDVIRADHLLGLADALGASGSYIDSIRRYEQAAKLANRCADQYLHLAVLNNLAFTQYEAGLVTEAVATAERLRAEAEANGQSLLSHDSDTIARAYTAVGRFDDAIAVLEPVCAAEANGEDCDGLVMALLTLTEVQRLSGALDQAQASLDRGCRLIEQYALTGQRTEALREQAELHAARGLYREAYEAFRAFHVADAELRALERDRRARTLHAIFEATEARRSSEYFRELSVRDPMTGLHNRRHMDSRLTEMLAEVQENGLQLTIGLLDLDHFKRINDTRSHAVGDEVLRQVAGILETAVAGVEGGLAARMGGEEFVLLLPGVDRREGVERLDRLRREIAGYAWADVTEGVPVTVSIGVSAAPQDGVERSALLSLADRNMYVAKRAGRDRVVA